MRGKNALVAGLDLGRDVGKIPDLCEFPLWSRSRENKKENQTDTKSGKMTVGIDVRQKVVTPPAANNDPILPKIPGKHAKSGRPAGLNSEREGGGYRPGKGKSDGKGGGKSGILSAEPRFTLKSRCPKGDQHTGKTGRSVVLGSKPNRCTRGAKKEMLKKKSWASSAKLNWTFPRIPRPERTLSAQGGNETERKDLFDVKRRGKAGGMSRRKKKNWEPHRVS